MDLGGKFNFPTPESLQQKIDEYFKMCDNTEITVDTSKGPVKRQKPYTISGLCVYLKISRECWSDYKNREAYREVCQEALTRVENYTEESALLGTVNPIFPIFSLKANHQWIDRVEFGLSTQQPEQLTNTDIQSKIEELKRKRLAEGRIEMDPKE